MKAWVQLITVCSLIIAGAVFTGCDKGSGGKKDRYRTQQDRINQLDISEVETDMKKLGCQLSDSISSLNERSKIACTRLDRLEKDELQELGQLLKRLEELAVRFSRDRSKTQQEQIRYRYLAGMASDRISDVLQALNKADERDLNTRIDRIDALEEMIEEEQEFLGQFQAR